MQGLIDGECAGMIAGDEVDGGCMQGMIDGDVCRGFDVDCRG